MYQLYCLIFLKQQNIISCFASYSDLKPLSKRKRTFSLKCAGFLMLYNARLCAIQCIVHVLEEQCVIVTCKNIP